MNNIKKKILLKNSTLR